jgi:hypothetical protein
MAVKLGLLTFWEEHGKVCENRVLSGIFGPKSDEIGRRLEKIRKWDFRS